MSGQPGKLRIAVVFVGRSAEHPISGVSAGAVLAAVDRDRYDVVPVGISRGGGWVLPDPGARLAIVDGELPEVTGGAPVTLVGDPSGRGLQLLDGTGEQIGRASCRERVEISVVAVSLK